MMKIFFAVFLTLLAFPLTQASGKEKKEEKLELPKGLFVLGQLEKAKEKATADKKVLAFLVTDEGSTDFWDIKITKGFIDAVEKKAVIVYLAQNEVNDPKSGVPELVLKKIEEMRKPVIPLVVVTNPQVGGIYTWVSRRTFIDPKTGKMESDKSVDYLKKEMREIK